MALREPDPETAVGIWDEIIQIESAGGRGTAASTAGMTSASSPPFSHLGTSLYQRGNCYLKLRQYSEALRDHNAAVPLLRRDWLEAPSGRVASLPTAGMTVPEEVVLLALAYDGMGLAQGQQGDWGAAVDSHARAVGTAAAAGAYEAELPVSTAFSGLRGGAGECIGDGNVCKSSMVVVLIQPVPCGPSDNGIMTG